MAQGTITLPDGKKVKITGSSRSDVEKKAQNMVDQLGISDEGTLQTIGEFGLRRFVSNILGIPRATGEALALGGAGAQTLFRGGEFSENLEQQKQQQPAAFLSSLPSPEAGDVLAAGRAALDPDMGFSEAQMADQLRMAQSRERSPVATAAGDTAGDVATLLTGRAPIARARAPKLTAKRQRITQKALNDPLAGLPARARDQLEDTVTDRIIPFLGETAKNTARGIGRAGETGIEGATLAILNEGDPISTAALGAGGQAAGSLGLHLAKEPVKRLLPVIGVATVVSQMWNAVGPDQRNVFEAFDFAIDKTIGAFALGALGALAGAGRFQGKAAERFPVLMDSLTTVPRGAVLSRLQELTNAAQDDNPAPLKVMEQLSVDPAVFTEAQQKALGRALTSEKNGAFVKEVNRLMKVQSFRERLGE